MMPSHHAPTQLPSLDDTRPRAHKCLCAGSTHGPDASSLGLGATRRLAHKRHLLWAPPAHGAKRLHAQTDKRSRRQATHARSSPPATHAAAAAATTFFFGDIRPSSTDVRQDQHMIRCRHTGSHAQADTRPDDEHPPSPATYAVEHSTPGRTNT
jgi:hypothetical protein